MQIPTTPKEILDVRDIYEAKIDEKNKSIEGYHDMVMEACGYGWGAPGTWDFQEAYSCRYKNFYLGTKPAEHNAWQPYLRHLNLDPEKRYYSAFRAIAPGQKGDNMPYLYESPKDLKNYHKFCEICNVKPVYLEPTLANPEPALAPAPTPTPFQKVAALWPWS